MRKGIFILHILLLLILITQVYTINYCAVFTSSVRKDKNDGGYALVRTRDAGYTITGYTESFGLGEMNLFLIELDYLGEVKWAEALGGPARECGYALAPTRKGYAVTGVTSSFGAGEDDLFLLTTKSSGTMVWAKAVGGEGMDIGNSLVTTADDGFLLAGATTSFGAGGHDLLLAKFDHAGGLEWAKACGGAGEEGGNTLLRTEDDGFAIVGYTTSFRANDTALLIANFNVMGELEWAKLIGGDKHDRGQALLQTVDGGLLITGVTAFLY